MTDCTPDFQQALHFLELLGRNGDTRFRAFPHKLTPPEIKARLGARKFGKGEEKDLVKAHAQGRGVYVVINPGRDNSESITSCIAYFAEFDGIPEDQQIQRLGDSGLPEPSIVVRTGGGSLHIYWLLSEPITDKALWQQDMKRLAAHLGSDPSINDPSRVMRLPGFWYMGPDQQPVAKVEIVHESTDRFTRDQFIALLPELPPEPERNTRPTPSAPALPTSGIPVPLLDFISKAAKELVELGSAAGSNNDDGLKLALELVACHDWIIDRNFKPEPSAEDLYEQYIARSAAHFGPSYDRPAAWRRFEGARAQNPLPATPIHKLEERLAYHQRQYDKQHHTPKHSSLATAHLQHAHDTQDDTPTTDPLDEWEAFLQCLVDPSHHCFEKNIIRRQIRAATAATELSLRVSPDQIRARLIQKQRELLAGTEAKGVEGGTVATFAEKRWLISNLIAEGCLTGIAAFAKVGKTKCLTEVAASLVFQQPFMGNTDWQPAPGPHKLILWWTDQPGVDSAAYLKARGLMHPDGTLHHQILRLFTQDDNLCWDDQGLDELIRLTTANPDAVLLTDSFYANVQPIYGSDQAPESGGALIDIQTFASHYTKAHVCAFHSPQETGAVGVAAMRGHGSAKGVVSSTISLHFLEHRCPSGSGKWVADKENPHRRMVTEGRLPYNDLLVQLNGAAGTWKVIGKFQQALAELQSDDRKGSVIDSLTEGQRETLEWVGSAMGIWKDPSGATAHQIAACKVQPLNRQPTKSEVEQTRTQLHALVKKQLLSETRKGASTKYSLRS